MLDDEFKKIEDFLKVDGNSELQLFSEFEKLTNNLIDTIYKNDADTGFIEVHKVIYESYIEFNKNSDNVYKDFAIIIILLKKLLEMLKNPEFNNPLNDEDKRIYLKLANVLVEGLKEEIKVGLSFYGIFSEYMDGILNIMPTEI